jgi:hypothetical protein
MKSGAVKATLQRRKYMKFCLWFLHFFSPFGMMSTKIYGMIVSFVILVAVKRVPYLGA